jgi:hypothetical protein
MSVRCSVTKADSSTPTNVLNVAGRFDVNVSERGLFFFWRFFACVSGWSPHALKRVLD